MFKTNLKLSIRYLLKNKLFSLINILGLSIGIAASLLLFLYTGNELSYEKFHEGYENIYRIRLDRLSNGEIAENLAVTCGPVGPTVAELYPEVEDFVTLTDYQLAGIISNENYKFRVQNGLFASESFFNFFSYKLIKGDPNTVLNDAMSIVLSESIAKKFFGDEDPMGKTLSFNNAPVLKVTGIFEDVPENSHIKFDMLVSYNALIEYIKPHMKTLWTGEDAVHTYVRFKPGTDTDAFEKKLEDLVEEKAGKELREQGMGMKFYLTPLADIHLNSHCDLELETNGSSDAIYFLIVIAIVIIIIAWINYINLSTARSLERSREIGIRKVCGATHNELRKQFLIESVLINMVAAAIALVIVEAVYPWFSTTTGMEIGSEAWSNPYIWIIFSCAVFAGAVISGFYPAFVLSSVNTIQVLKSKSYKNVKGLSFRKVLIVLQFVISISLIIGTIVVNKQVTHMLNQDIGVNTAQTLVIHRPEIVDSTFYQKHDSFISELKQISAVDNVCFSGHVPGEPIVFSNPYIKQKDNENRISKTFFINHVDHEYMGFYGLEFLAGRDFFAENMDMEVILNRRALELFDFKNPEDAINAKVHNVVWEYTHTVVGVIENFHQQSLKEDFAPTIYKHFPEFSLARKYSIRLNATDMQESIAQVEEKFNDFFPGNTFEYFFLDKHYNAQYNADRQFGKSFFLFSLLAVIIACVGLFALSLYTIIQRTNEIAVRKVFGASVSKLFVLLTKEYMILIIVATLAAVPISFFTMSKWLENYASRIELNWLLFVIPTLLMVALVLVAIVFQVFRVARTNPAEALKYE